MTAIDRDEHAISRDLEETERGIRRLKRRPRKNLILSLLNPMNLIFTVVGALILITLTRMAIRKWRKTYMPEPDGSKLAIFGIPIPGWDMIKAFAIGVRNFILVGLPNMFDTLKMYFGKLHRRLFGRKGILRNAI